MPALSRRDRVGAEMQEPEHLCSGRGRRWHYSQLWFYHGGSNCDCLDWR
jgi:hypothetical protein